MLIVALSEGPRCPHPVLSFLVPFPFRFPAVDAWDCLPFQTRGGPPHYQLSPTSHQFTKKKIFFSFPFHPRFCRAPALWNPSGSDISTGKLSFLPADWPGSPCLFLPGGSPSVFSPLSLQRLGVPCSLCGPRGPLSSPQLSVASRPALEHSRLLFSFLREIERH